MVIRAGPFPADRLPKTPAPLSHAREDVGVPAAWAWPWRSPVDGPTDSAIAAREWITARSYWDPPDPPTSHAATRSLAERSPWL
jgi:hypothetical protein